MTDFFLHEKKLSKYTNNRFLQRGLLGRNLMFKDVDSIMPSWWVMHIMVLSHEECIPRSTRVHLSHKYPPIFILNNATRSTPTSKERTHAELPSTKLTWKVPIYAMVSFRGLTSTRLYWTWLIWRVRTLPMHKFQQRRRSRFVKGRMWRERILRLGWIRGKV